MKIYRNSKARANDTFRELLSMWEESGYCSLHEGDDSFCWVGDEKKVLLYDHPRFDFVPEKGFHYSLFANTQLNCPTCKSWIFWARHPRKLEKSIEEGLPDYNDRKTESIFLGKIENGIQLDNRKTQDWASCVEKFSMPIAIGDSVSYPYTQEEYLEEIKNAKFGLCLPGYGPKCNREIEYLGSGTVPIMTPGCGLDYHDELKEGEHYILANTPEEVTSLIENIQASEWNYLSNNGIDWYNRNCSREGSFNTTKKILEENANGLY